VKRHEYGAAQFFSSDHFRSRITIIEPINMKTYLLLAMCLVCAGCGREASNNREMRAQLDGMRTELAAIQALIQSATNHTSIRWATANKQEINMAVMQWGGNKAREKREAWMNTLTPDVQEKIRKYDSLQSSFMQMRMAINNPRRYGFYPPPSGLAVTPPTDSDFVAMSNRVEEAKKPIADVLEQRDQMQVVYNADDDTVDQLIAEYVKGRYDLVTDSSFPNGSVLFSSYEDVPDITEGVIKYFKEKSRGSDHAHE
jgi:hypothetical protein